MLGIEFIVPCWFSSILVDLAERILTILVSDLRCRARITLSWSSLDDCILMVCVAISYLGVLAVDWEEGSTF